MTGESVPGAPAPDLPYHSLSVAALQAIAHGEGDGSAVRELLGAERSRRLLLLRALDDGVSQTDVAPPTDMAPQVDIPSQDGTGISHRAGWDLLERVQAHAPTVFEDVLMSPHTGMWLSLALRQLRGRLSEDAPLWIVLGHLSALAASAGARAGLDFAITVPVRHGLVPLPTLGCAVLPVTEPWSEARVEAKDGRLTVTGAPGEVVLRPNGTRPGWEATAPGWHAVRRVLLDAERTPSDAERILSDQEGAPTDPQRPLTDPQRPPKPVVLEDLDPYRTFPRPSTPRPLPAHEAADWERMLVGAWEVLLRDEPESADAMRQGLMSMAPAPRRERFRPYSGTAGDAFGGINASLPDDVPQLAATLVHEFQHTKLGGLMHLEALTVPTPAGAAPKERFYAPWRDDPRPLGGLLQGIYAFAGVTRFWRTHRHTADAAYAPLAHFEFALWRIQVWSTLTLVRDHEQLTPLGRHLLASLAERCAPWMTDTVPAAELALAEEAAADHHARWRAHHLRPPATAVAEAVSAWRRGDRHPPAALADAPELVPDPEIRFLDSAAVLTRYRLAEPDRAWRHTAAETVEGASEADVLLAVDEHAAARDVFVAQLSDKGAPVAAWTGLGRALAHDGDEAHRTAASAASRLLLHFPERARAVQDALIATTGRPADPLRLAAWLGHT
ncbi:HEXXH motif domain-containing protein [Streptomyces sp. NPDC058001]|uniref:HEXXH motif domain-containing protein n=1 Tax=Streptomyces sp. NPDC058001 TaxID=3346300 RepID=UPI0036ED346A